jgi:hypothetical protein
LIGGAAPAVDTATALPNQIPRYVGRPDSRIGYAKIGIAKVTGTVIGGATISASATVPSVTADGVYLAAGKAYVNSVITAVVAVGYGGASSDNTIPSVTVSAHASLTTHLDSNLGIPAVASNGVLLVGNTLSANSAARVETSATMDSPAVAVADIALPSLTVSAGVLIDGTAVANITLPNVTTVGIGGAAVSASVPSVVSSASTTTGNTLSANTGIKLATQANILAGGIIVSDNLLRLLVEAGTTRGVVATGTRASIRIEASASASSGSIATAATGVRVSAPSSCLVGNRMVASGGIPLFASAYATNVIGTTVWRCVNLRTGATTDWEHTADYIASHRNVAAIANIAGVARIGGDTDAGSVINYNIISGLDDLDTAHMKRIADIWLGGRNLANVSLTTDNNIRRELTGGVALSGATERRVKVPRGIKTRYVQIGVYGEAPASLDSLVIEPEILSRRVR